MDYLNELIGYIEEHSVKGIRECFSEGVDPNAHFKGVPLIYELTSEYTRMNPSLKNLITLKYII